MLKTICAELRKEKEIELWVRSQDKMDLFKINRLKNRGHNFKNGKKEY